MYVNATAELVTVAPVLRPERRFAPLARGLRDVGSGIKGLIDWFITDME